MLEIISEKNRVRLETAFSNQEGEAVITGEAVVMLPPQWARQTQRTEIPGISGTSAFIQGAIYLMALTIYSSSSVFVVGIDNHREKAMIHKQNQLFSSIPPIRNATTQSLLVYFINHV